jgi:hypothetical protein
MQNKLIEKRGVLEAIKDLFRQEHETLKKQPINEQNIIGSKLTVLEIELKKLIKGLKVMESESESNLSDEPKSQSN